MHEYSIVQALLERVQQEAAKHGATRVHALHVRIGEISGVEIELLRTAYETIRRGTDCENATLQVSRAEARWECETCGDPIPAGRALTCARCGARARLVSGDEIMLDRIELEVA